MQSKCNDRAVPFTLLLKEAEPEIIFFNACKNRQTCGSQNMLIYKSNMEKQDSVRFLPSTYPLWRILYSLVLSGKKNLS